MLVVLIVVALPLVWVIRASFASNDSVVAGSLDFIGLGNYSKLFGSQEFRTALSQTVQFVIVALISEVTIGLGIALALDRLSSRGKAFRLIFALPLLVAPVVAGFLFRWMFTDQLGIVNRILGALHLPQPAWLAEVWPARTAILMSDIWLTTPFVILIFYAALASQPTDILESAKVEGASAFQTFRYIRLPLLGPAFLVVLVFRFGDAFRIFDVVYIMTRGGPAGSTDVVSSYIYRQSFENLNFATAAAASVVVAAIILVVCYTLFLWLYRREVEP
jgi:multiple sugar transport system permease protein